MPPWKPVAGYGKFEGERRLSSTEIQIVTAWANGGAPEGNPRQLPPAPHSTGGWQLGPPDLVVQMQEPYVVAAHSDDQYRCFVVPLPLKRMVYVRAVEFRPSNRRIAHHALIFADSSNAARKRAEQEGGSYSCFGTPGFLPSAGLGGWSPGASPFRLPEGAALRLQAESDLVFQIHFHSRGEDEREQSSIGLYFTNKPPDRALMDIGLVSRDINIPPGDRDYRVRDHFEIPVNVHAVGIIPHAHYLCRNMKGWAILPDGKKVWLLWIKDWDFNWQDQYHYAAPVPLPAGTRVEMEFTYDNSGANPHNPNSPPQRVTWGPGSRDEMAGLHIQVVPDRMEDVPELGRALWGKIMRMVGGSFYKLPPHR